MRTWTTTRCRTQRRNRFDLETTAAATVAHKRYLSTQCFLLRLPSQHKVPCNIHADIVMRFVMWCTVAWCIVVWCIVVWCIVVWCIVLWCIVVWCIVMWCIVVWCVVVWGTVVWCIVMWCFVLWCRVSQFYLFLIWKIASQLPLYIFLQKTSKD